MPRPFPARGLYAVTPEGLQGEALLDAVREAVGGGAKAVQYRNKSKDRKGRKRDAAGLTALCRALSVPLIINDDVELAVEVQADGVHVGREDPAPEAAREYMVHRHGADWARDAIIGVSCYDELARARQALASGADYIAFGSFFPSATKPSAVRAALDLLSAIRPSAQVPIVGIGGITAENAGVLLEHGVDVVAVVQGIFGAGDPKAGAESFSCLFEGGT